MKTRGKDSEGKTITLGTYCNICRQQIFDAAIKLESPVGEVDVCQQCAIKLGYKLQELAEKKWDMKEAKKRRKTERKGAKHNKAMSIHFETSEPSS